MFDFRPEMPLTTPQWLWLMDKLGCVALTQVSWAIKFKWPEVGKYIVIKPSVTLTR